MFNFSLLNPTAVPTLSGMMLLVLSLLLFVVAFKVSKQKSANTGKYFIALIGVTALVSSIGGTKLITDVQAGGPTPLVLSGSTGSVNLNPDGFSFFVNEDSQNRTYVAGSFTNPAGSICTVEFPISRPPTLAAPVYSAHLCTEGTQIPTNGVCAFNCELIGSTGM